MRMPNCTDFVSPPPIHRGPFSRSAMSPITDAQWRGSALGCPAEVPKQVRGGCHHENLKDHQIWNCRLNHRAIPCIVDTIDSIGSCGRSARRKNRGILADRRACRHGIGCCGGYVQGLRGQNSCVRHCRATHAGRTKLCGRRRGEKNDASSTEILKAAHGTFTKADTGFLALLELKRPRQRVCQCRSSTPNVSLRRR